MAEPSMVLSGLSQGNCRPSKSQVDQRLVWRWRCSSLKWRRAETKPEWCLTKMEPEEWSTLAEPKDHWGVKGAMGHGGADGSTDKVDVGSGTGSVVGFGSGSGSVAGVGAWFGTSSGLGTWRVGTEIVKSMSSPITPKPQEHRNPPATTPGGVPHWHQLKEVFIESTPKTFRQSVLFPGQPMTLVPSWSCVLACLVRQGDAKDKRVI